MRRKEWRDGRGGITDPRVSGHGDGGGGERSRAEQREAAWGLGVLGRKKREAWSSRAQRIFGLDRRGRERRARGLGF
jgi:hypothetical protein